MDIGLGATATDSDLSAAADLSAAELLKQYFVAKDQDPGSRNANEEEIIEDKEFAQRPVVEPQQVFHEAGSAQATV